MNKAKSARLTAGLLDAYGLGVAEGKRLKSDARMLRTVQALANVIDGAIFRRAEGGRYESGMFQEDVAFALVSVLALARMAGIDGVLEAVELQKREREGE